jgi:hypothetical protein
LREVPVVESDERSDTGSKETVDEIRVELDPKRVDRVIAAAQRNDTRPREREAVRLDAI